MARYSNNSLLNRMYDLFGRAIDDSSNTVTTVNAAPALKEYVKINLLDAVTSTGASSGQGVGAYSKHTLFVSVTTSATVLIQGSFDNTNFFTINETIGGSDISSGVTDDGVYTVEGKFPYLRVNATAVSDALTVDLVSGY